jgi:hypothetical protein
MMARFRRWADASALAAALILCAAPALAAPRLSFPSLRDMQTAINARRALLADPKLSRLNLSVSVRDGVATLWGPVPNADVGRQAAAKIAGVRGIQQVKSDLYRLGPTRDEDLPDLPFVYDAPTRSESASPDRDSGQINLTGRGNPAPPAGPLPPQHSVSLLAPLAAAEERSGAVAPAAAVAVAPAGPVMDGIARLRRAEERFRAIVVEVRDATVTVHLTGARGEDAMAFAQAISRLTGVERVLVQN